MQFHPQRRPHKLRRKHQDSESTGSPAPQSGKVERVLRLQRTIGNRATQSMLQRAEATTIDPAIKSQLNQAVDIGNAKDYDRAIEMIEEIVENNTLPPANLQKCYHNLGIFYSRNGNNFQALEYFGKSIAMGPISPAYSLSLQGHANSRKGFNRDYTPKEVYDKGVEFFEARNYDEAIDRFSSVLNLFNTVPNDLRAKCLYNLGACYYRVSKYHQALAKFEEALAIGSLPAEVTKFIQKGIKKAKRRIGVNHVKKAKRPTIF